MAGLESDAVRLVNLDSLQFPTSCSSSLATTWCSISLLCLRGRKEGTMKSSRAAI